ncbi:winged helix-turn-helix domain-containing protein [Deinococcus sp.]|uniref:winged helix-turn-helix domain-containing protein n=1 Tax=Deinococcus sp. TaxID=47478 RepID=UPI003CC53F08
MIAAAQTATPPSQPDAAARMRRSVGGSHSLDIDPQERSAFLDGQRIALTSKEYLLIELLFVSRGRLFSRDDILERLWGLEFRGDDRVIDTYVKRVRSKLGPEAIETVRGLGYRCPLPDSANVAQPHLKRLPPEARLLTRLAQRILQVTDSARIIADVYELLRETYGVRGVSLWALPAPGRPAHAGPSAGLALPPGGVHAEGRTLASRDDLALVPLGTGDAAEGPWALLAFWGAAGPNGWPLEVKSVLDAVAGLVNPALRLNGEIQRRQEAEREVRSLNADLEGRVQVRTLELARANADLEALYELAQTLAGAGSLSEVLSLGLSRLARLAGAPACSLWRLRTGGLSCVAAHAPDGRELTSALQGEASAAAVAALLLRSVDIAPAAAHLHIPARIPTRSAPLPGGGQVLLIPVGSGLPEVHALYLETPGVADSSSPSIQVEGGHLGLLEAGAHAFGLAFERQRQTLMIERAALNDELTELPNRRALLSDLSSELSYSQRHRSALTLSLFEIADIRTLNARLGFAAGNDLIRALAGELRAALRLEDRVYRLGGALLVTLVRSHEPGEQGAMISRLDALAARLMREQPAADSLRLGHASSPDEAAQPSELLRLALERLESGSAAPPPADLSKTQHDEPGGSRP